MGNQQTCCIQNQNDENRNAQYSINPIKNGRKIYIHQKNLKQINGTNDKDMIEYNEMRKQIVYKESYEITENNEQSPQLQKQSKLLKKWSKQNQLQLKKSAKDSVISQKRWKNQKSTSVALLKGSQQRSEKLNELPMSQKQKGYRLSHEQRNLPPLKQKKPFLTEQQSMRKSEDRDSLNRFKEAQRLMNNPSERNYRASQQFSDLSNQYNKKSSLKNEIKQVSQLRESHFRQNQNSINHSSEEIIIQYAPIVSKLITKQKPFQNQLYSIPKNKIKKIKVNGGRDIYKGQVSELGRPHGLGILIKQNDSVLVGRFNEGNISGMAYFIFNNSSFYKGNILLGKAHDVKGQFHSKTFTYIGGFEQNEFCGKCQQLGEDYYFKGQYKNNKRRNGVLSWQVKQQKSSSKIQQSNRRVTFDKDIKQKNEKNSLKINDLIMEEEELPPKRDFNNIPKYNFTYQGAFDSNQKFTGVGMLKDPNGIYNGDFLNGMKNGKGVYLFESKLRYQGQYENDEKSGYGILKNCDDTTAYQGYWKNGLPNGKGSSYDLKGKKTTGQFINGLNSLMLPTKNQQINQNPQNTNK